MVLGLAIASALSLGVADYLAGAVLRTDGRMNAALPYTAIGAIFGAVFVLIALPFAPPEHFTSTDLAWSVGAGAATGIALPLLMVGMARGPMAVVAPVIGLVSLAVPAVIGPLLGDRLSGLELAGLLVTFPAAILVSVSDHVTEHTAPIPRAVLLGATAGALLGTSAIFFGQTSTASGIGPGVAAQLTTALLLTIVTLLGRKLVRPQAPALLLSLLVGVLTALAIFLSVLAYQRGPVAIVAAVIALAPGPTVVLARFVNRERIRPVQLIGFGLGVAAVVLFAFG